MKKFVSSSGNSKLNFVKRVLLRPPSRHRGDSASSTPAESLSSIAMEDRQLSPKSVNSQASAVKFQSELQLLRSQVATLQISVNQMQNDNEEKERALISLAKEKEQLTTDLRRHKRTNLNLRQQLEDERAFYYKEKEQYCLEMNNMKKLKKQNQSSENLKDNGTSNEQKEIANLKNTLNQILEANYNLSVKFLRMKNTKLSLKKQLCKMAAVHEKSVDFYKTKVDEFQKLMDSIVQEQFYKPIPPSNKKYLHLLKQNGALLHENLSLQITIDRLNKEIEKIKYTHDLNETNRRLQLIHHNDDPNTKIPKTNSHITTSSNNNGVLDNKCKKCNLTKVESNRTNITNETKSSKSGKSLKSKSSQTTSTRSQNHSRNSVQVIYDKTHTNSIKETKPHRHKHKQLTDLNPNLDLHKNQSQHVESTQNNLSLSECSMEVVQIEKQGKLTASDVNESCNSKFDLMTVSNSNIHNNKSDFSIMVSRARVPEIFASNESQSAPEILKKGKMKL